jgi:hypothetical protein
LAGHVVLDDEHVRFKEIERFHDEALPKVKNGLKIETGEIPGEHRAIFPVDVEFYRRKLDDLDPFIEEDLRD